MDKLKPILAQKFWILSGLCLLLPLTGWWVATAAMSNEYTTRVETLKKAFSGIPQPGPNKNWTDRVLALNADEERKVKETGEYLWNQQLSLMTWPESVAAAVEKAGYRKEIPARTRTEYRYAYDPELIATHQIPAPFDPLTGEGMVEFSLEMIPNLGWGTSNVAPSTEQMWDAQEDIWMYRTLLQSVREINKQYESTNLVNSKIKQILFLELRGGTPGGAAAAAEAAAALASGAGGGEGAIPGMMPGAPGMGAGMGAVGGGTGGADTLKASFDPAEQLGSDDAPVVTPEGGGDPTLGGTAPPSPPGGMPGGPGGTGMGGATVKKRYIEETPRFKTRGFYMELVLDHRCLPEFISELSDSKWPIRVIRVQTVDLDLNDIGTSNVVGAGAMGGAGMGGGRAPMMGGGGGGGRRGDREMAPMRGPAAGRMPGMGIGAMGGGAGRPARPPGVMRNLGENPGVGTEGTPLDIQNAMTNPALVTVALSGIITLYLPPELAAAGQPGAEGAPGATPATTDPATATTETPAATGTEVPGATPTAAGTTAATTETPATAATDGATTPAKPATDPAAPATGTPETPPAETKPAAEAAPATPAEGTPSATPAPTKPEAAKSP
ncbi:MAG: hypothetical protein V4719_07430 [Planctomycetota bacterium]